ncbi:hypothetical protein BDY21DRAFT_331179 [Lineolata rhizophorae]|uniref:WD40-repeat-containing domain protein n=1 Tax=Lineolata rhizophorae TaxID=578093 RepID=A0A6A6PEC7_9PEZI|nr:hypothetical protein BDY21DRAFT_331179 [Lineolata rhizophorae]
MGAFARPSKRRKVTRLSTARVKWRSSSPSHPDGLPLRSDATSSASYPTPRATSAEGDDETSADNLQYVQEGKQRRLLLSGAVDLPESDSDTERPSQNSQPHRLEGSRAQSASTVEWRNRSDSNEFRHSFTADAPHKGASSSTHAASSVAFPLPSTTPSGQPFTVEDDNLLLRLKERESLQWKHIHQYFPSRTLAAIEDRYKEIKQLQKQRPIDANAEAQPPTKPPHSDADNASLPCSTSQTATASSGESWSPEDENRLVSLRERGLTWTEIQSRFPTRSMKAVQARYSRVASKSAGISSASITASPPLAPSTTAPGKPFSDHDDRLLEYLRDQKGLDWHEISQTYFPNKTVVALRLRYGRYLSGSGKQTRTEEQSSPASPSDRIKIPKVTLPAPLLAPSTTEFGTVFTAEDDRLLIRAYQIEGGDWTSIQKNFFPNRSVGSIRTRYSGVRSQRAKLENYSTQTTLAEEDHEDLAFPAAPHAALPVPSTTPFGAPFTKEDDRLLVFLQDSGLSWSEIKKDYFPNRTEGAIRVRYQKNLAGRPNSENALAPPIVTESPYLPLPTRSAPFSPPVPGNTSIHPPSFSLPSRQAISEIPPAMEADPDATGQGDSDIPIHAPSTTPFGHPFTEEDDQLLCALRERGLGWAQIMQYFPNRSRGSVQTRWCNHFGPSRSRGNPTSTDAAPSRDARIRPQSERRPSHVQTAPAQATEDLEEASMPIPRFKRPNPTTLATLVPKNPLQIQADFQSLLRQREAVATTRALSSRITSKIYDTYGPSVSFTGTSHDVNSVAWAPDGNMFAAGSVCLSDPSSMQYNRPNNLLLGDRESKILRELPHHKVPRQKMETGINSTHSMHVSQDPSLYMTVSAVEFDPHGRWMYSAGYDQRVRIWDISEGLANCQCSFDLKHKGAIDVIAVNPSTRHLATGSQRTDNSIKVLDISSDRPVLVSTYSSPKATERPESRIFPSCLRWGVGNEFKNYLLGGFTAHADNQGGEVCVWDMEYQRPIQLNPAASNVFDCTWSAVPSSNYAFAVGCKAGNMVNKGIRTVIRLYGRVNVGRFTKTYELECPARDMNDIVFCPFDNNFISAGCTDGNTYVWDVRNHHHILHVLPHGDPVMQLDVNQPRDLVDTGIRFCSWGENRSRFYTGSSDGIVKSWDVYRAPEDACVQDVTQLNSGVMCGSFSPDFSSLLLGEVNGTVTVLDVGKEDSTIRDTETFRLQRAELDAKPLSADAMDIDPRDEDSGIQAARSLVTNGSIKIVPVAGMPKKQAIQGDKYDGPFDRAPDAGALRHRHMLDYNEQLRRHQAGAPCRIAACVDSVSKLTYEEQHDSGRSADRIPWGLDTAATHDAAMSAGSAGVKISTTVPCSACRAPARVRLGEDDRDGDGKPLCERCGFACFRCGKVATVSEDYRLVHCGACDMEWRADVLGYTLVRGPRPVGTYGNGKYSSRSSRKRGDLIEEVYSGWTEPPELSKEG